MTKQYANPPLVEALAEFQFIPREPWDITVAGLLYGKIKDEFPEKEQHLGVAIGVQVGASEGPPMLEVPQRMRMSRENRTAMVQVGPDMLAVNHLKPYPTWEPFKELVLRMLTEYRGIADPEGLRRIGLRYINDIKINEPKIELCDYFNYYPKLPAELTEDMGAFNARVQLLHQDGRDRLILTVRNKEPGSDTGPGFILDLDYVMVIPEAVTLDDVTDWLEMAHAEVERAFEACITENTRAMFSEEA